jgi:hypothetical protein
MGDSNKILIVGTEICPGFPAGSRRGRAHQGTSGGLVIFNILHQHRAIDRRDTGYSIGYTPHVHFKGELPAYITV